MKSPICALAVLLSIGCAPFVSSHAADTNDLSIPKTDDGLPGAGPIRRADWFQQTWNGRRAEFQKTAPQEKHALVFLGDSITQGWGGLLAKHFPGVTIANRGPK